MGRRPPISSSSAGAKRRAEDLVQHAPAPVARGPRVCGVLRTPPPDDDSCWIPRRILLAGAAAPLLALAACGFRPLYATPEADDAVSGELAAIRINQIGEGTERRVGQILRNELIDRLTAGVGPQPHRYTLIVEIEQRTSALQIQTTDTVTRYNLVLRAKFWLRDATTNRVLHQGTARSIGSYDVVESEYATLVAEQETARDAARDLSGTLANILALYFQRGEA